ncbi:MAG: glutathione peroxidase [Sphingobacteriaceae bacterium]|nr:glutathione peroxidase [Sphingobacteriaceae bacterium]
MNSENSIHKFKVKLSNGEFKRISDYKGKVLLIVNTASECGFAGQFKDLQDLQNQFTTDEFEILAFPSNDFGKQEPLSGRSILSFCEINYGVKFTIFDKVSIRGAHAHPLFLYLGDKKQNGKVNSKPKWNFHKYLINQNGEVVDYFYPFTKPNTSKVKKKIQRLLTQK